MAGLRGEWIEVDTSRARRMLANLTDRGSHIRPVASAMLARAVRSVVANFEAGGRPHRWAPIKRPVRVTHDRDPRRQRIRLRRGRTRGGKLRGSPRPLQDTGHLRNSIIPGRPGSRSAVLRDGFRVGTNLSYAAVHQYGSRGGQIIRPVRRQALRWPTPAGWRFARRVVRGSIPARPFVVMQAEDLSFFERLLRDYILTGEVRS